MNTWRVLAAMLMTCALGVSSAFAFTTIPDSALTPTTQLHTDMIGGGIGNIVVMTGGGNAPWDW